MKRSIAFLAFFYVVALFAWPVKPKDIIRGVVANPDFIRLAQENEFHLIAFEVIMEITPVLQNKCQEWSRSASFVKVTITPTNLPTDMTGRDELVYYFSTSEFPEDIKLCP